MINLLDFEPWWRFGVALLIGALLGMEREFFQQKEDSPDFAGIRTFSLIALLGSVAVVIAVLTNTIAKGTIVFYEFPRTTPDGYARFQRNFPRWAC